MPPKLTVFELNCFGQLQKGVKLKVSHGTTYPFEAWAAPGGRFVF